MQSITRITVCFLFLFTVARAEDGYELWLRYKPLQDQKIVQQYINTVKGVSIEGNSNTLTVAKKELETGLSKLLGTTIPFTTSSKNNGLLHIATPENSKTIKQLIKQESYTKLGDEGFLIKTINNQTIITANTDIGILYGVFHFLRLLQTQQDINNLYVIEIPKVQHRILNHWDNLDRTVERGYAGFSLWDWHKLPGYISPRYKNYARANASVGINGTVLTNVNANAFVLTPVYLEKVAALADIFRPYGIKVYLTARFSAPIENSGLETADPLDKDVIDWWQNKAKEIYKIIPDFGGFLVKANSEGQPGPQNYNRTHADGANMLAKAVEPFGGIVMWRAFVYDNNTPVDRAKQAYNEFIPLDGKFNDNVLVQVKNGAIDFQPREPFHPMFGAMPNTPLMMEFQITQEYLGFATHLVYLAALYKECLNSDTYTKGKGSTVAKVIDGTLHNDKTTGMAGVSNIGTDRNWCGHPFAQANWYSFGRLAWNHELSLEQMANEWIKMTFTNDQDFVDKVTSIMLMSREAPVDYMTPLGLHHQMAMGHHYGPGPWVNQGRADWTSVYYHEADEKGIGFNRSLSGSDAVSQYHKPLDELFGNMETCPEKYLLWFHHVNWNHKMKSGRTLWDELCYKYNNGVATVRKMLQIWNLLEGKIDNERFEHVKTLLKIQEKEAKWWRDACLLYFQTFSGIPVPEKYEKPEHTLDYYMKIDNRYAPGN